MAIYNNPGLSLAVFVVKQHNHSTRLIGSDAAEKKRPLSTTGSQMRLCDGFGQPRVWQVKLPKKKVLEDSECRPWEVLNEVIDRSPTGFYEFVGSLDFWVQFAHRNGGAGKSLSLPASSHEKHLLSLLLQRSLRLGICMRRGRCLVPFSSYIAQFTSGTLSSTYPKQLTNNRPISRTWNPQHLTFDLPSAVQA